MRSIPRFAYLIIGSSVVLGWLFKLPFGLSGIPYAFKQAGIGLGVMVLCLAGGLVNLSLRLLMKAGEMSETKSYQVNKEASS